MRLFNEFRKRLVDFVHYYRQKPSEVDCLSFGAEAQLKAILLNPDLVQWDPLTHVEDMRRGELPYLPGGPIIEAGCPSLSNLALADLERSLRDHPTPPGVTVLPLAASSGTARGSAARSVPWAIPSLFWLTS